MDKTRTLPPEIALTERSQKFYDGTFQWDLEGFTDDKGGKLELDVSLHCPSAGSVTVYRSFDCDDPAARAPTPLPVIFWDVSEDEDYGMDRNGQLSTTTTVLGEKTLLSSSSDDMLAEEVVTSGKALAVDSKTQSLSSDKETITFPSCSSDKNGSVTVRHDDLFRDHMHRERLIGKMEGILIASRYVPPT